KIPKVIKRELVRAVLERTQGMDISAMMPESQKENQVVYDDVEEILNIPYVNREGNPLAMDIFNPKDSNGKELPVMVLIHGGGFTMGDRRISRPYGRLLAHKGYLVFALEYRLAPRASIAQALDDVCAGLDLVGEKLVDFDVDFNRVFLAAESAGAFLATYVAAMHGSEKLQKAIGYKASRVRFKAIGLLCGMVYTNRNDPCGWILSEQLYGDKRENETFLQFMNPEHPEIIDNLPPVFLTTSTGDFVSNYTFLFHKALKENGKATHMIAYADDDLMHAFNVLQPYHPKSLESTEKMLQWFDEQAALQVQQNKLSDAAGKKLRQLAERIEDGSMNNQKMWKYIKECNSIDEAHLDAVAIIDCSREYTYRQMFAEWDRYARVFSGLNICSSNHSRAAICGTINAEPLFAFYALNMTGVTVSMLSFPDFLPTGNWKTSLKKEKITDLIISDMMVTPQLWRELEACREELGLRNIILLHSKMGGVAVGPAEMIYDEFNYHALKTMPGTVFMEDLTEQYKDTAIRYARFQKDGIAVITHTSGTTRGVRKPLPYTDMAVNYKTSLQKNNFRLLAKGMPRDKQLRILPEFDFSSYLVMCGLVNGFLANGDTLVLTCFGFFHPRFIQAVDYYNISVLNASGFMIDKWMERTDLDDLNLTSVKMIAIGGSFIPPEKVKRYEEFFRSHGYEGGIVRGYGMSEAGSASIICPPGCYDDILGYPDNKENFRILDEEDGQFHSLEEGPRTGVMYIASDSQCCNELDGEKLFEFTEIDGRGFLCSNDMIRLNENGSITYVGRADKYFANNEGVTFDSGLVDVQMSAQPAVNMCAVVPVLEKRIHDTVPVLYVVPNNKGAEAPEQIRQALVDVYITSKKISDSVLPVQFVVVDSIPCNNNGKVDIYRITRERLTGEAYDIVPVRREGVLADIQIKKAEQVSSITAGTVPEGMDGNSAFDLFGMFNSAPSAAASKSIFGYKVPDALAGMLSGISEEKITEMSNKLMKPMMKLAGRLYGSKDFKEDIEE
ncbi:MAG: AMP-binding protein, partial [Clostridia bacterium]|nr:AMP-binding protein [Clostridia bacterium]